MSKNECIGHSDGAHRFDILGGCMGEGCSKTNYTNLSNTSTHTIGSTPVKPVDMKSMFDAITSMPPEPFAEYMRKLGLPHESGHVLVLPQSMCEPGAFLPKYVRTSPIISSPMILSPHLCGMTLRPQVRVPGGDK